MRCAMTSVPPAPSIRPSVPPAPSIRPSVPPFVLASPLLLPPAALHYDFKVPAVEICMPENFASMEPKVESICVIEVKAPTLDRVGARHLAAAGEMLASFPANRRGSTGKLKKTVEALCARAYAPTGALGKRARAAFEADFPCE